MKGQPLSIEDDLQVTTLDDEGCLHGVAQAHPAPHAPPSWRSIILAALWVVIMTYVVLVATGCSGTALDPSKAPGGPVPVGCYATAVEAADKAANERCGGVWTTCPHRQTIMQELDVALALCDTENGQ